MAIQTTPSPERLHWNYFLALEHDLESVARYVEFSDDNFRTHSIELAHLLFAAASEVDVLCRRFCAEISPVSGLDRRNIGDYKRILTQARRSISKEKIFVPRYGITLTPWANWDDARPAPEWWESPLEDVPEWWTAYNKVKHERGAHFGKATLKNALNALGGLLVVYFDYQCYSTHKIESLVSVQDITAQLRPESTLLRLDPRHYEFFVGARAC